MKCTTWKTFYFEKENKIQVAYNVIVTLALVTDVSLDIGKLYFFFLFQGLNRNNYIFRIHSCRICSFPGEQTNSFVKMVSMQECTNMEDFSFHLCLPFFPLFSPVSLRWTTWIFLLLPHHVSFFRGPLIKSRIIWFCSSSNEHDLTQHISQRNVKMLKWVSWFFSSAVYHQWSVLTEMSGKVYESPPVLLYGFYMLLKIWLFPHSINFLQFKNSTW